MMRSRGPGGTDLFESLVAVEYWSGLISVLRRYSVEEVKTVRFHFQVRTGTHVMMTEVADLSSPDEARVEAAKRTGRLLHAHAGKLWADEYWT
jgi:hypothetical protein